MPEQLSNELKDEIRSQAKKMAAKWTIMGVIALLGLTATGWWLVLKPKIIEIVSGVPKNAVVAFADESLNPEKCPKGWSSYKMARSRVIVGIGDPRSTRDGKLDAEAELRKFTNYGYGQHGGQERVVLSEAHIPEHQHVLEVSQFSFLGVGQGTPQGGLSRSEGTASRLPKDLPLSKYGKGDPHDNMPPFIALYFCKKN